MKLLPVSLIILGDFQCSSGINFYSYQFDMYYHSKAMLQMLIVALQGLNHSLSQSLKENCTYPTGNNVHVTCMFHANFINLHAQQNMHVIMLMLQACFM